MSEHTIRGLEMSLRSQTSHTPLCPTNLCRVDEDFRIFFLYMSNMVHSEEVIFQVQPTCHPCSFLAGSQLGLMVLYEGNTKHCTNISMKTCVMHCTPQFAYITLVILTTFVWGRYYYYPHFTEAKTEEGARLRNILSHT